MGASSSPQVVVVGAGICGLAAAYELARRGVEVVVLERGAVGGEQSAGLARIFRVAHGQARLCALAAEARAGWRRWEEELGAGRLLGSDGLVVAEPRAGIAEAMRAAGARWESLSRAQLGARLPFAAGWDAAMLDPAAGSIRVRRVLRALAARVEIRQAEVAAVSEDGTITPASAVRGCGEGSAGGSGGAFSGAGRLRADAVLVCVGVATPALAATADISVEARFSHHVRLTYEAGGPGACLISPEGYGVALGSTGRWAFGLHDGDVPIEDADAFAAHTRERQAALLPRRFPGLVPEPVAEVRCVNVHAPWLDAGGDGWQLVRRGAAIAFAGANLMKFAPLIGERLARTALGEDGLL